MGGRLMWFWWVEFWDADSEFWWAGFISMMKMEQAAAQALDYGIWVIYNEHTIP
jgi:hypothetical protein